MTDIVVDVSVPYRIDYLPHRCRKPRHCHLFAERKVSLTTCSATEAPPEFRVTSAAVTQDPTNYVIRSFENKLWWPVLDPHDRPVNGATFLEGLAAGIDQFIGILNPGRKQRISADRRETFEDRFRYQSKYKILTNQLENNFAEMQRVAARTMLCDDMVYFAGGVPVFYGSWQDPFSNNCVSLSVGNLLDEGGPRLFGPDSTARDEALWESYAFDLRHVTREVSLLESRGVSVELAHHVERLGKFELKDEALHLCGHIAVKRLLDGFPQFEAAYLESIPDRCRRDSSKLIPSEICRDILRDALGRSWPNALGKRLLEVALKHTEFVLARLELHQHHLLPEDEEALASLMA